MRSALLGLRSITEGLRDGAVRARNSPARVIQDDSKQLQELDANVALQVLIPHRALAIEREDCHGVVESVPGQLEPCDPAECDPIRSGLGIDSYGSFAIELMGDIG
jgi:hypothetical protein